MHWTFAAINLLVMAAISAQVARAHNHLVEHIDRQTNHVKGVIRMSTQDAVNAIVAQLGKVKDEILGKLADAQAQIDAAGVAEQVDLSALTAAAQSLDDIVPDAVEVPVDGGDVEPAAAAE